MISDPLNVSVNFLSSPFIHHTSRLSVWFSVLMGEFDGASQLCAHPAILSFESQVTARKQQRCAWDGKPYTLKEFQEFYGEAIGASYWESASHFEHLKHFTEWFDLWVVRSSLAGCDYGIASCALFGLWVPGCLLLVDVHHLAGKLKGSRLVTEAWHPDIWDAAWQIGPRGKITKVLDLCTKLLDSIDPLVKLGRIEMEKVLKEFCDFIDGKPFDLERVTMNPLVKILCVDVSIAGPSSPFDSLPRGFQRPCETF